MAKGEARRLYDVVLVSANPLYGYSARVIPREPGAEHPIKEIVFPTGKWPGGTKKELDPTPDMVVYLTAKRKEVIDWAHATYDAVVARHISDFLRTSDIRHIATLTAVERRALIEKMHATNDYYDSLVAKLTP